MTNILDWIGFIFSTKLGLNFNTKLFRSSTKTTFVKISIYFVSTKYIRNSTHTHRGTHESHTQQNTVLHNDIIIGA